MSETRSALAVEWPTLKASNTAVLLLTRPDGSTTNLCVQEQRGTSPGGRRIEGGHGRRTG